MEVLNSQIKEELGFFSLPTFFTALLRQMAIITP
jgi:hypothetical protein